MDIHARNIEKTFGRSPALHNLDLDIKSGELIGLLGPSGSGKTTLLRIIAGLELPTSGQVLFGAEDASSMPVRERRVGFVFQHYALFRHMTVAENIAYGLRVRPRRSRPSGAEIDRRVNELLGLVQLGEYGRRYPKQLSGGQQQRVALARALAVEPRVLLLDEPFGALDARVRMDLRRWLRELHDRTGHTTIFVTHDQEEALELSDRVAVLNGGRIEQVGTPDEVYDLPATAFVFGFIGESNLLPLAFEDGVGKFEGNILVERHADNVSGPATLHFRPHEVAFSSQSGAALHGIVIGQRRVGPSRRVDVGVGGGHHVIEVEAPVHRPVETGKPVGLTLLRGTIFPENREIAVPLDRASFAASAKHNPARALRSS